MFVWIPIAALCVIPIRIVRWVLVLVAFLQSGYFLTRNVYPILASVPPFMLYAMPSLTLCLG